ncbi:TonB-dependent siderophore receptor [Sphingomonas lutea]|uniref:TonB-dependent siderophore receptor n=1 Tax=Sphingomonas lutea TaxID=1045317 RepID=A0A7G9SJN0_9SPHN|nr:TonB-dependent siderophore receptor [Sphingomonas lutea]QNN68055.1 TonB-dependent siderophore receptor [Sphingomonas lutea]
MTRSTWLATVAVIAFSVSPARAADAADDAAQGEIIVTGERGEYGVRSTSTATKTNTDVRNIPQALTVISESQIEDQGLRSIAELLTFVPGATAGTGEANRDQITLRGNNTTADFFIDGVRDDVQYFRDFYNVDRVEVLKGPNAMIFGRGGGGGIVNRVGKRSTLNAYREGLVSSDSFGGVRVTADVDQPLSGNAGVRINALYENGDSFRRHVDLERYGLNPTAGIQVGPATRIDIGYEYFHDRRTTDRGLPSLAGEPLEGRDKSFFGDPDDSFAKADVNIAHFRAEHEFRRGVMLRNITHYGHYDKFYQNIYPNSAVTNGEVVLGAYNSRNDRRNLFSQTDLIWEGKLGSIDHTFLAGFELGRQKSRNHRVSGAIQGLPGNRVSIDDPTVDVDVIYASTPSDANNRTRASVAAIYVQEQLRPTDWLEIVAGLRFDRFKLEVDDLRAGSSDYDRTDNLWSPRLGLVLKPTERMSVYGSFSRSYLPQSGDQFSGLTSASAQLKPERFDNLEIGGKWEPIEGLLATAAVYQLDRTNSQSPNPDPSLPPLLTGEQRSRGIELGLERSITDRWQVSAGYALQKAEIRERTSACNPAVAQCEVPLVPRHSFSLWNRYDFNSRVGAGLGVIARSKSYASISNNVRLPGYARVDAAVFYKLPNGMEAQLNLENVFGADYFPTAHNDNNIAPGAPRTLKGTVGYRF